VRVLLTLLFALFVGAMWLIYGTDVGPLSGLATNMLGAVVGIIFMAVLVVIGFRVERRRG